jgi:ABC-type dipeptide/oligopeptide/nickel transport system ATPase component
MRQRVVIAMAVANGPRLLIADEPTTGLDVVTQAEVLQLLHRLRREMDLELVLVTHDLGVVRAHADDVVVMQDAQVVEHGPVAILDRPEHPHLQELLARSPSLDGPIRPWSQRVDAVVAP